MNLTKIAARMAMLGDPEKYGHFKDFKITIDKDTHVLAPMFVFKGKYVALGREIGVQFLIDYDLNNDKVIALDDIPGKASIADAFNKLDDDHPVWTELERIVQESDGYKDLVEGINNPTPGQQYAIKTLGGLDKMVVDQLQKAK